MLTDIKLRALKPKEAVFRVADAGGLCIEVTPSGSKLWRYRYRFMSKAKMISFGAWPEVTLAEARSRHAEARGVLRSGRNPSAERQSRKRQAKLASDETFSAIAQEWRFKAVQGATTSTVEKIDWHLTLVPPSIGLRPIREISAQDVLTVVRPLETRGIVETAHRVKQRMGQIFRYAVATGRAERDPTLELRGALTPIKSTSRAAVTDPIDVAGLMLAINGYEGHTATKAALQLAPLLFARPGNLRAMEWSEIDFDAAEWRIPAGKMKMREAHIAPLARQAVAILLALAPLTGRGRYVFPSIRSIQRPMSENTINAALRRLGYDKETMTGHGFRAMASTRLNEMGWAPDVIERQLAHTERNRVRAAYNRAQYLDERRKMMQFWADYIEKIQLKTQVTPK